MFTMLTNLPLGTIYWRVKTDLTMQYSPMDAFYIQSDSTPLLIPIRPDTIIPATGTVFAWHPAVGAANNQVSITKIDLGTVQQVALTTLASSDTSYTHAVALAVGTYRWTVSANGGERLSVPDTFWVKTKSGVLQRIQRDLPKVYYLSAMGFNGHVRVLCAIPRLESRAVTVILHDIRGRVVSRVFAGNLTGGYYQYDVTTGVLAQGIYFCRLQTRDFQKVSRVVLKK